MELKILGKDLIIDVPVGGKPRAGHNVRQKNLSATASH